MIPLIVVGISVIIAVIMRIVLIRKSAHRCKTCGKRMRVRLTPGMVTYRCPDGSHFSARIEKRRS